MFKENIHVKINKRTRLELVPDPAWTFFFFLFFVKGSPNLLLIIRSVYDSLIGNQVFFAILVAFVSLLKCFFISFWYIERPLVLVVMVAIAAVVAVVVKTLKSYYCLKGSSCEPLIRRAN
jgi:hypothetical protein